MDALGYFVAGAVRPLVLLILWVPLMASVLWLVRRFAPRHERWLFYRITLRGTIRAIRRLMSRHDRVTYIQSERRRY